MEHYALILGGGVVSMVVGSIWYGPLFGKKWMEICGVTEMDIEKRKQMQKEAMPLYVTQFLLTLVQILILSLLFEALNRPVGGAEALRCAEQGICMNDTFVVSFWSIIVWLGFVMPTIAGSAMWNNDPKKVKWARFLIQSGYQLVMFLIFGFMIQMWM